MSMSLCFVWGGCMKVESLEKHLHVELNLSFQAGDWDNVKESLSFFGAGDWAW